MDGAKVGMSWDRVRSPFTKAETLRTGNAPVQCICWHDTALPLGIPIPKNVVLIRAQLICNLTI